MKQALPEHYKAFVKALDRTVPISQEEGTRSGCKAQRQANKENVQPPLTRQSTLTQLPAFTGRHCSIN